MFARNATDESRFASLAPRSLQSALSGVVDDATQMLVALPKREPENYVRPAICV